MPESDEISPLESHLGYWMRFVSNHVSHSFAAKVESRGVTVAEWVVLRELFAAEEAQPSAIAERLGMTRGAISKLIDRLEAKDLVRRRAVKDDQRAHVLTLTAGGKKIVPLLAQLADQNDAEFFGHLTRKQQSMLMELLNDIVRHHGLKGVPVD